MPPIPPLFVLQVPHTSVVDSKSPTTPGSFICTSPSPKVYLLSFTSPPDNRLTPAFNSTFLLALDIIEYRFPKGVVLTTSTITKFYSNGLDYEAAIADPNFFPNSLFPLWRRLITYPMPTIAVLNGHAFAGGLMMAMMHDYRIMNAHKGFLCLNELDFGAQLRPPMASVFKVKLPNSLTFRNMVLESRRYPALEALKEGIIDGLGGLGETLAFVDEMKLVQKAQSRTYGNLKEELYKQVVQDIDEYVDILKRAPDVELASNRRDVLARQKVDDWEISNRMSRSKL